MAPTFLWVSPILSIKLKVTERKQSEITLNPDQLKEILKSAIVELVRDRRQEVSEFMAEIIEDVAMERAIAERERTELTSRDAIFKLLEPQA